MVRNKPENPTHRSFNHKKVLNKYHMTQEQHLVILCACIRPDSSAKKKITKLSKNPKLDWETVYYFALRHRVWLLVYQNINLLVSQNIPEIIKNKFKKSYIRNTARNIRLTASLINLIESFNTKNILVLPFKGPVLAKTVYNNIDLRYFADLDILIKKKDILKAWSILKKKGFQAALDLTDFQKLKYAKTEDHMVFVKKSTYVELHWEMTGFYLTNELNFRHIFDNAHKLQINNKTVFNLSHEKLILYLCIHGSKDVWENLEQICSIAELLKQAKHIDWKFMDQLSKEWECRNMMFLGLYLSWNIFKTPIPDYILKTIKQEKKIKLLAKKIKLKLFKSDNHHNGQKIPNRFNFHHIRIRDSRIAKLIYIFRLLFSPTEKEWRYFPMPASLSFTLYFLRPIRLTTTIFWKRYA